MPPFLRRVPANPADHFDAGELTRSRAYHRPLARARALRWAVGVGVLALFAGSGAAGRVVEALAVTGWVARLAVVLVALQLATLAPDVVIDAWVDLRHDREWGRSTVTASGLLADEARSFTGSTLLAAALLVPLYGLVRSTGWWWLGAWAALVAVSALAGAGWPAPTSARPLPDGELRRRIVELAGRAGVPASGAFVTDGSRRTTGDDADVASVASVEGLGRRRRIVMSRRLLDHPPELVEQVVAHELGHWRRRHPARQLAVDAFVGLAVLGVLRALAGWPALWSAGGAEGIGDPVGLPAAVLAFRLASGAGQLVSSWWSRALEREADAEALALLGDPTAMAETVRRIQILDPADLDPSWPAQMSSTHPPIAERLAFARAWSTAHEWPAAGLRPPAAERPTPV